MKKLLLILSFALSLQGYSQFSQDFEGTTLPTGWSVLAGGDTAQTWFLADFSLGTPPPAPTHSGTRGMVIQYSATAHNDILSTPAITVTAGLSDQLSFWGRSINPTYPEEISVVISTTTNTASAFTTILVPVVAPVSGNTFEQFTFSLSAFIGQTIYIGFKSTTTDKDRFDLDDVVIGTVAACPSPTALAGTVNLATQATLTWTSANPNFEILVQLASAAAPATNAPDGTGVNVAGTSYVATLPTANTLYTYYVRTECSAGFEYSTWSGPFNFNNFTTPPCPSLLSLPNLATNVVLELANGVAPTPASTRVTRVTLSWTAPEIPVAGFRIYMSTVLANLDAGLLNPTTGPPFTGTSVFISNRLYNTTYYWKIVSEFANGVQSTGCDVRSFTTGPSPGFCMNGILSPATTYTPEVCDGVTANTITPTAIFAGRYSNVNLVSGQTYTFGSTVATDFFSLSKDGGLTAAGFGLTPYTWTSNFTGVVRVYAHTSDQCGPSLVATNTRTTTVICNNNLTNSTFENNNFKFFPNPIKDVLNLSYDKNITNVSVINLLGQEVISLKLETQEAKIDMSHLNTGVYLVKVTSANESKIAKIIKE